MEEEADAEEADDAEVVKDAVNRPFIMASGFLSVAVEY
jgi:hypothetical protein